MKIILVVLCLFCISLPVFAEDWKSIVTIVDEDNFPVRVEAWLVRIGYKIPTNTRDEAFELKMLEILQAELELDETTIYIQNNKQVSDKILQGSKTK